MNGLSVLDFETNPVRMMRIDGDPCWIAADVCRCLGIANHRDALGALDDDEKGVGKADTLGGKQDLLYVNESGLYHLIFKSRKPEAVRFRKWVTREVLPTIRRTGSYGMAADPPAIARIERIERCLRLKPPTVAEGLPPETRIPLPTRAGPFTRHPKVNVTVIDGKKQCRECLRVIPLESFTPVKGAKSGIGGVYPVCRACSAADRRARYWAKKAAAQPESGLAVETEH